MLNIPEFINTNITHRQQSLFAEDIRNNDALLTKEIRGSRLLVIGGAGTIGSSFIKAALIFEPKSLVVVDLSENGLTELTRDLRSGDYKVPATYRTYPLDFGSDIFSALLGKAGPFDIVANFAAHKHVRSEKDAISVRAMIHNNVIATYRLLEQLANDPPRHFFCVSTDKASNPVNVMGATKKMMEQVVMCFAEEFPVTTARFANVAFSNGSLLDGFINRINKKQPLSSPKDVVRYFVSPEESGQICLLACVLGRSADIFFPKLDESTMRNFADIAVSFLSHLGFIPDFCDTENEARQKANRITEDSRSYPLYLFASDTSGEKLFEEFFSKDENPDFERFSSLGVINSSVRKSPKWAADLVHNLRVNFDDESMTKQDLVRLISKYVDNFNHIETGKSLDDKM